MDDVTQRPSSIERGDPQAAGQLLPLVYDELRKLAALRVGREAPGLTLQATALVHEAYLRLVGDDPERPWRDRGHFFGAAAGRLRTGWEKTAAPVIRLAAGFRTGWLTSPWSRDGRGSLGCGRRRSRWGRQRAPTAGCDGFRLPIGLGPIIDPQGGRPGLQRTRSRFPLARETETFP